MKLTEQQKIISIIFDSMDTTKLWHRGDQTFFWNDKTTIHDYLLPKFQEHFNISSELEFCTNHITFIIHEDDYDESFFLDVDGEVRFSQLNSKNFIHRIYHPTVCDISPSIRINDKIMSLRTLISKNIDLNPDISKITDEDVLMASMAL